MKPAWRGVVAYGEVWAWPTVLMSHNAAFVAMPQLVNHTCRWRQWEPGGPIDFDPGARPVDKMKVELWVERASQ